MITNCVISSHVKISFLITSFLVPSITLKFAWLPPFFFVDSNSPCKDLLFPCGPNLVQKPLYLVGSVLNEKGYTLLLTQFTPRP